MSVIKLITEKHPEDKDFEKVSRIIGNISENINQMLSLYKLDNFKRDFISERVNLYDICKEEINLLKDYFISMEVFPKLEVDKELYVYSDQKWLKLVIHQLLTNAIKYSHASGVVKIISKKIKIDSQEKLSLEIIDNGIGIDPNEISKIFDLFYIGDNGRNNADSSGIGLYIAKSITDYLGHKIELESDKSTKTTTGRIIF